MVSSAVLFLAFEGNGADSEVRLIDAPWASRLVGGENPVQGACCVFNEECDEDEALCSSNGSAECMAGNAEGYRLVAANNRDICSAPGSAPGFTCTEDYSEETACAYDLSCEWDTELLKCVSGSETPITVPTDCDDTCPGA